MTVHVLEYYKITVDFNITGTIPHNTEHIDIPYTQTHTHVCVRNVYFTHQEIYLYHTNMTTVSLFLNCITFNSITLRYSKSEPVVTSIYI